MIRTITTPGPGLAFLLCLQLLPFLPRIQANEATPCYAPDTKRIDDRFMPCISMDGMDSMCCRLNDHDPDICKPNGLCYWENVDGGGRNGLYRGLCTSQGWDTSNWLPKTICADDDVRYLPYCSLPPQFHIIPYHTISCHRYQTFPTNRKPCFMLRPAGIQATHRS